jgi:CRP/FNR family transcriptional regulator, anaerobic regulatory protein
LEETKIFYISYNELQATYQNHITFNIIGRKLTEKYYKLSVEREEIMRMPEAMDRYNYLIEHFSDLMNAVPDKHLASFIRISPVHLSRLRNKRTKKAIRLDRN